MLSEDQKRLVEDNVAFARYIAHKFDSLPLEWEERCSTALYGLVKAAERYRPETGCKFTSFASVVIRNQILMRMRKEKRHIGIRSLDAPINREDGDGFVEVLVDETAERAYERIEVIDWIKRGRENLTVQQRKFLELMLDHPDLTQKEYAGKLGISQPQVSKLMTGIKRQMSEGERMIKSGKTNCKDCVFCKMVGRSKGWKGRGFYYCENPDAQKLPLKDFGRNAPCFICFGTFELDTKPTIKTRPRWCPLGRAE